jgi:translation initiation factor IF-2
MVSEAKVCVRMHKIIYKFLEDIENFVHDVRQEMDIESGKGVITEVVGRASISQLFHIKNPKGGKSLTVAGARVVTGVVERKGRYRLLRNGKEIATDLKLSSLKKF